MNDADRPRHRARPGHGSGRRGLARWVWVTPLALVVLIALVVSWMGLSRDDEPTEETECIAGNLTLMVWADPAAESTAQEITADYLAGAPVVRDFCVIPQIEVRPTADAAADYLDGSPGAAAVWFPAGTVDLTGMPGAPTDPPVVGSTPDNVPVPLIAFGSSSAVTEDAARAAADLLRSVTGS
ncbi:hypothetical protein [Corynebacterium terpenotabidum]|uniref:Uncharacterized protein n=1 Tax=Corynebacterium terpenotabidum Y-11 TaxID=1200352 RepID=S4XDT7_9CORY|nr:hypothetical protein [Corynebacterium terpenotabidum]AGP30704.1 hypothetical protein A606_05285 [Corynebacterium terpenotabidum Y-11]